MGGFRTRLDPELLGKVASLTRGQQRWLRTVLQSVFSMEEPARRGAADERTERPRRPRRETRRQAEQEPRRQGVDDLISGERSSEEEYPELADELRGIADIAGLLRESGQEKRSLGEELMRLLGADDESTAEDEEEEDDSGGAHFN